MAAHFASLPLNYGQSITDIAGNALTGAPSNMIDADPASFWSADATSGNVRFSLGGNAVAFDAYYIISQNLGAYTVTGLTSQSAPLSVSRTPAAVDTLQYVFHIVTTQTGAHADFSWTSRVDNASPIRIYQFYVLKLLLNVAESDGFGRIDQSYTFRGSQIQEALDGSRTRTRPLGNRGKWRIAYAMNVLSDQDAKIIRMNDMFAAHPNFTHVVDYPTHPDRVFRAYLLEDVRYNYVSNFRGSGSIAQFAIEEV